jgi:hypothetical protein
MGYFHQEKIKVLPNYILRNKNILGHASARAGLTASIKSLIELCLIRVIFILAIYIATTFLSSRYHHSLRGHWTATLLLWRLRFPQNVIRSLIVTCPRYNHLLSASNIPGSTESFRPGWDKT